MHKINVYSIKFNFRQFNQHHKLKIKIIEFYRVHTIQLGFFQVYWIFNLEGAKIIHWKANSFLTSG